MFLILFLIKSMCVYIHILNDICIYKYIYIYIYIYIYKAETDK